MSKTLMIHGAWSTPASFDLFGTRFDSRYTVMAPPRPLEDRPIDELRCSPHPGLSTLTIANIVEHCEKLIHVLPNPPIRAWVRKSSGPDKAAEYQPQEL
jgi:hypothetical protein